MTTNQTIDGVLVSREVLVRVSKPLKTEADYHDRIKARGEVIALLDAPAVNTDVRTILLDVTLGFDGMGHEVYARSCEDVVAALGEQGDRIEELETELHTLKSAQPQGEPVAWRVTGHGGLTVTPEYPRWATGKGSEGLKVEALVVAEQPAPVAFDFELAAQKIASCMDYPWEHMPEQGRNSMREHAKAVVDAALGSAEQPAPVVVARMCDCNQGRLPCSCIPDFTPGSGNSARRRIQAIEKGCPQPKAHPARCGCKDGNE